MEGRSERVRKSRVAEEFDAFVLIVSAGSRGWQTATPDDVFNCLCFLGTPENNTKMVHEISCSSVGHGGDDACL